MPTDDKATCSRAGRAYLDNVRMARGRRAVAKKDAVLARTLDSDTMLIKYIYDRGLESLEKEVEG